MTAPPNTSSRFPNVGPGSVSQAGSGETIHQVGSAHRENPGVGCADRDDLRPVELAGHTGLA
jgi:hypothetical protein